MLLTFRDQTETNRTIIKFSLDTNFITQDDTAEVVIEFLHKKPA